MSGQILATTADERSLSVFASPTVLEANHKFVLDVLAQCPANVGVAIENCGEAEHPFSSTADDLILLVDLVNSPRCGVCWDTGHGHLAQADQESSLAALGHRLKCLHVQENDGVKDLHLLPYAVQKGIDWAAVAHGLAAIEYHGTFNFEAHYAFKGVPDAFFEMILQNAGKLGAEMEKMINDNSDQGLGEREDDMQGNRISHYTGKKDENLT